MPRAESVKVPVAALKPVPIAVPKATHLIGKQVPRSKAVNATLDALEGYVESADRVLAMLPETSDPRVKRRDDKNNRRIERGMKRTLPPDKYKHWKRKFRDSINSRNSYRNALEQSNKDAKAAAKAAKKFRKTGKHDDLVSAEKAAEKARKSAAVAAAAKRKMLADAFAAEEAANDGQVQCSGDAVEWCVENQTKCDGWCPADQCVCELVNDDGEQYNKKEQDKIREAQQKQIEETKKLQALEKAGVKLMQQSPMGTMMDVSAPKLPSQLEREKAAARDKIVAGVADLVVAAFAGVANAIASLFGGDTSKPAPERGGGAEDPGKPTAEPPKGVVTPPGGGGGTKAPPGVYFQSEPDTGKVPGTVTVADRKEDPCKKEKAAYEQAKKELKDILIIQYVSLGNHLSEDLYVELVILTGSRSRAAVAIENAVEVAKLVSGLDTWTKLIWEVLPGPLDIIPVLRALRSIKKIAKAIKGIEAAKNIKGTIDNVKAMTEAVKSLGEMRERLMKLHLNETNRKRAHKRNLLRRKMIVADFRIMLAAKKRLDDCERAGTK